MKKVLFVATTLKHHILAFHIPHLQWFYENGYEVHVCARKDCPDAEAWDIPYCHKYYDLPFERSPYTMKHVGVFRELKKIIDCNDYTLIYCHTPMGAFLARLAAKEARMRRTKVLYMAHGFHFYVGAPLLNWLLYYPVERWLSRYTDVLITINEEDYERAKKSFRAGCVEYVPGVGIDFQKFCTTRVDFGKKRRELGLGDDDFVIVSTGELNSNKNHRTVLRALHILRDPSVKYLICGRGPLRDELMRLVRQLGLEHQVILTGYRNDIIEINHIADLFVFPSFREGLSVALMEAMACGLPVVCSDIRGNRDLIDDGKGGFLVEPDNVIAFANHIKALVDDSLLRKGMGLYNYDKIQSYDIGIVSGRLEQIYKTCFREIGPGKLKL